MGEWIPDGGGSGRPLPICARSSILALGSMAGHVVTSRCLRVVVSVENYGDKSIIGVGFESSEVEAVRNPPNCASLSVT
jgi:hypothetical protein